MLVIRLQRTGRRNVPTFRLVVMEKRAAAKGGKVTEFLGHYLPARNPHVFEFKRERVEHWIKVGAQPSDTVARLLTRAGMKGLEKFIIPYTKKQKKSERKEEGDSVAPAAQPEAPKAEANSGLPTEAPPGGAKVGSPREASQSEA